MDHTIYVKAIFRYRSEKLVPGRHILLFVLMVLFYNHVWINWLSFLLTDTVVVVVVDTYHGSIVEGTEIFNP